ncbi:MAG TPA: hypothetical protein DD648_05320 [Candidatus Omnitrophica bacterium]|nr:hypothetical protein [Candidatus Omnitrophota bacterium]
MKKLIWVLIVAALLLPRISLAADPKAGWTAFQQQQREAQMAFFKKQQDEKAQFLKSHPDIVAQLEQEKKASQERSQKMREEAIKRQGQKVQPPKMPTQ